MTSEGGDMVLYPTDPQRLTLDDLPQAAYLHPKLEVRDSQSVMVDYHPDRGELQFTSMERPWLPSANRGAAG
jgi:hypothetical protein